MSELETLSAKLHTIYQAEAKRQGDVRHYDDYAELSEDTKDFDRALARFILERDKIVDDEAARLERERSVEAIREQEQLERQTEYGHSDAAYNNGLAIAVHAIRALGPLSTHLAERDREQFNEGVEACARADCRNCREGVRIFPDPDASCNSWFHDLGDGDDIECEVWEFHNLKRPPAERDREGEG